MLPEVGKSYNCYDDGKVKESRKYTIKVIGLIPFSCIDKDTLEYWSTEINRANWLYSDTTDFFIKSINEDSEIEYFSRTKDGGWFSFNLGDWSGGSLDVDGKLTEELDNYLNEVRNEN